MITPVIDLHCDLLLYLSENPSHNPYDAQSRCSFSQLRQGGVTCQVLAIFTETVSESAVNALNQAYILQSLVRPKGVDFIVSLENASCLCNETEPLSMAFRRLQIIQSLCGPVLYISFTWNHENRFGGGCRTSIGLKADGERLLDHLDNQNIAVDLSHASDALANDIFNYVEKKRLNIPVIASHSNFRSVHEHPRNLPDSIAKEIIRRHGVIGLNLCVPFLGKKEPSVFIEHLEYAYGLGGENVIALGADFFHDAVLHTPGFGMEYGMVFSSHLSDSACYPYLFDLLAKHGISRERILALAGGNAARLVESAKTPHLV